MFDDTMAYVLHRYRSLIEDTVGKAGSMSLDDLRRWTAEASARAQQIDASPDECMRFVLLIFELGEREYRDAYNSRRRKTRGEPLKSRNRRWRREYDASAGRQTKSEFSRVVSQRENVTADLVRKVLS